MRRAVLLASISGPCLAAARSWTCSLGYSPVERIELSGPQQNLLRKEDEGGRQLRTRGPAYYDGIALPSGHLERHLKADTIIYGVVNNTSADSPAMIEGRICTCAMGLASNDRNYYCALPADHCSVWRRWHTNEHHVTCYEDRNWQVGFARNVWYYLCFALLLLAFYPLFSGPGRHAVRYLVSKCFPRMNTWVTEHLLQAETEARNMVRDEYEYEARLQRRTEGWVSGYSLRTKRYNPSGADAIDGSDVDGRSNCSADGDDAANDSAVRDEYKEENEDCTSCAICLLNLEDGDRVADLSCVHLYHADCLGEWILKKNSCPLCQNPEIAKEIRTFEAEDDSGADPNGDVLVSRSAAASRWGQYFRDRCLDVATGRRQWVLVHRHHVHRIRMARREEGEVD